MFTTDIYLYFAKLQWTPVGYADDVSASVHDSPAVTNMSIFSSSSLYLQNHIAEFPRLLPSFSHSLTLFLSILQKLC